MDFTPEGRPDRRTAPQNFRSEVLEKNYLSRSTGALLLTNTFFLGCGLNDPDFQLLFENFSYRFPNAAPHYMTYADRSSPELESLVRDTRKLKILKYSRLHEHKELIDSLEVLVSEVEKERQEMGASLSW
jgi:hypothetical protein